MSILVAQRADPCEILVIADRKQIVAQELVRDKTVAFIRALD